MLIPMRTGLGSQFRTLSTDSGETCEHFRNLEEAPGDRWAYPAVTRVGD